MPGDGRVGALIRAMFTDLGGPVEISTTGSCEGGFLLSFREGIRGFHDLLTQNPSSLMI
jgi:hypothetical protein